MAHGGGDGLASRFLPVGRLGLECGRNPCRLRPRRGDTCGCHHSFLEGAGGIHPPPPSACPGKPEDSSGQLRRRRRIPSWRRCLVRGGSEPRSVVVCIRWAPWWRVIRALPSCRGWHLFLLLFLDVLCCSPQRYLSRCWLLWNTKRGETLFLYMALVRISDWRGRTDVRRRGPLASLV